MTRTLTFFFALLVALAFAAPATPKGDVTVTIRHQVKGCHSWSVNNGASKASLSVTISRGTAITFVDNDVMPHKLVLSSGPALKLPASSYMHKMAAPTRIVFTTAGTYHLLTKAGEDYPSAGEPKTIGEDNALKLTVVVH